MNKILRRAWLGPSPMPEVYKDYGKKWRILNPDIEVIDYSWHNLPEFLPCSDVMDHLRIKCSSGNSIELATQLADIIGHYLTSLGGIYANCDIFPVKPIPEEMWYSDWVTYEEKDYDLCVNAFTGGTENSPFWTYLLEGISDSYFSQPDAEMVFTTGPIYLTKKIKEWPGTKPRIYSYETVNPILWKQIPPGGQSSDLLDMNNLPSSTIGIHQWGHKKTGRANIVS